MKALIYILCYPIILIISRLPFSVLYILSDIVYFFIHKILGYRKKVVKDNLRLVFPKHSFSQLYKIEKAFYNHLCDIFLEIIKSYGMSKKEMIKRFKIKNIEVLKKFEKDNRSIFLICGHYGSWEWMMSLGYHIIHRGIGIYRPIKNPYFDRLIKKIRSKHNAQMITQKNAIEIIKENELKRELGIYGFASDQSPRPKNKTYWRKFLGIIVPVYSGAERLARELNIPVVFSKINRIKRGFYEVEFMLISDNPKKIKENEITDTFYNLLEKQIHEDPTQYFWIHKRFKFARLIH